jgi:CAAX prenyl protease-like protein
MVKYYIAPFIVYLVGATVAGNFDSYYPLAYSLLVAMVAMVTLWSWRASGAIRPHPRILLGVVVGVVGIVLWVLLSELKLEAYVTAWLPRFLRPGPREAYNPWEHLSQPWMVYGFIAFRLIGLAILVPIAEELFWRGFLSRWLIAEDWLQVPLGTFTTSSFFYVSALFTLAHPEWLAAAVYAVLINGLLYWKRDLWSCIVAHGVSNLLLGLYVLTTGAWHLW